jgi:hypothetical protein
MMKTMISGSCPKQKPIVRLNCLHTCVDIGLTKILSCVNCKGDDNDVLGVQVCKTKQKCRCDQPWSLEFKQSRYCIKKQTHKDVWQYMLTIGYRADQMEVQPKEKMDDDVELMDSNTIPDAIVKGRKPTSLSSNCKNLQSYNILPDSTTDIAAMPDAAPGNLISPVSPSDLMSAANLILQFTQGAQVESSIPNEIDTTTSSLTSTTSSLTTRSDPPTPSDETRKSFTTSVAVSTHGKEVVVLDVPKVTKL